MIVFWGSPRQATPGSSAHRSPSDPLLHDCEPHKHKDSLCPIGNPHVQPALEPDRWMGPKELKEVGDLQGLVGWGIIRGEGEQ